MVPKDHLGVESRRVRLRLCVGVHGDGVRDSLFLGTKVSMTVNTPAFYFLPKIHKQNITGRPIISGNNSPTEKISALIDEHIKQFVPLTKSYVGDTPDFIKKNEKFSHNGDFYLVTMDVTSLYTNIPNHEGLVAVTQTLIRENAHFRVQNRSLITLSQHVLHMNNFQFNGENYLQIGGTAMGTRVTPSYANLFMARLEDRLLANCEYKLPLHLRYIDDIFFIFPYSEADLHKFMHYMNNSHPTIKFTEEHSRSEVIFLDTIVKRLDNKLYTDLYTKPTDTHSYLNTRAHTRDTSLRMVHMDNSSDYAEIVSSMTISTDTPTIWPNIISNGDTHKTSSSKAETKPLPSYTTIWYTNQWRKQHANHAHR